MITQSPPRLLPTLARTAALLGALATLLTGAWVLWTAAVQSSGAPLAWRLHLLLLEALPPLSLLTGLVLATLGSVRTRRLGWGIVAGTLAVTLLWGALATPALSASAPPHSTSR